MNIATPIEQKEVNSKWVFLALWIVVFLIYIPEGQSGWVIDAAGWIHDMKVNTFWNFLNRTQSNSQSFYQLFALHYFVFYKLWGLNPWMWSLLYITVQAANAFFLFLLCRNLFKDSAIKHGQLIALSGAAIFCACPHISEVVIWKACSHYLQGLLFILIILLWTQKYLHSQQNKYIWYSAIVFFLSAFGLEIFYLIPFFVLGLILFYRSALGVDKQILAKSIKYFILPQLLILCAYVVAIYLTYKFFRPHKTEITENLASYLAKPVKYLFHILFLGRYFSMEMKNRVYSLCQQIPTLVDFYPILTGLFLYGFAKFKQINIHFKLILLLLFWGMLSLFFVTPLSFPGAELLVFYDRYTYFSCGFLFMLLALLAAWLAPNKYVLIGLFCVYVDFNLFFTIKVNTYWIDSDQVIRKLLKTLPEPSGKTVLLLNIPENMNGVPMVGAQPDGIFKALKEVYTDTLVPGKIYDVASYNMVADYNGAHVTVINDSVIQVGLNHMGTWWWYEGHGAVNYETPDYKVDFKTKGLLYELTLKHPADNYMLLYSVGEKWKETDMSLKNKQQD